MDMDMKESDSSKTNTVIGDATGKLCEAGDLKMLSEEVQHRK
jgi:hypothetical protein